MCGPSKNCFVFVPFGAVYGAYAIRPYDRVRVPLRNTDVIPQPSTYEGSKNGSVYVTVGGILWGVFDTPLQSGTYDSSKYRCDFPTEYVRPFKKLFCFRSLRGRLWGVFNTPLRPGTCDSSKYRCNFPTEYLCSFKKLSRFRPLRGREVGVCDTPLQPGTCEGSKNGSVYATVGGVCGAYAIRPYNRVRMALLKTVPFSSPSEPWGGAYSIRPYNWVCAILRNIDAIP